MTALAAERGVIPAAGYEDAMRVIDAVNYLPHAAPRAVLLQFGNQDTRPSPADAQAVAAAASSPKEVQSYDGGHELNEQAKTARENWLARRFGVA